MPAIGIKIMKYKKYVPTKYKEKRIKNYKKKKMSYNFVGLKNSHDSCKYIKVIHHTHFYEWWMSGFVQT